LSRLPNENRTPVAGRGGRLKLIVAYNGAGFSGWQSQARGNTIQDQIESALLQVIGQKIRVHGASRTDAGVHAIGQCAHLDLPPTRLTPTILLSALNASLPPQIRIMRCGFVASTFHARFLARAKVYCYRLATTAVLSPFELGRAWHVSGSLNDKSLRACANKFVGTHDFTGFAANRGHTMKSTIRTIRRVRVRRTASSTTIEFEGDGFLYKMARMMVGAIVRCALGKISVAEIGARLLEAAPAEPRLVAPAAGLTLMRVRY
jgi:tRNA pseudouridine38-40 synthase